MGQERFGASPLERTSCSRRGALGSASAGNSVVVGPAFAVREVGCHALAGELVGALVVVMAVMALDPVPAYVVALSRLLEPLPQLDIAQRLLIRGAPAIPLPALDPSGDAAAQIVRVGLAIDGRTRLHRRAVGRRSHQLHAVVGGVLLAALQLLAVLA